MCQFIPLECGCEYWSEEEEKDKEEQCLPEYPYVINGFTYKPFWFHNPVYVRWLHLFTLRFVKYKTVDTSTNSFKFKQLSIMQHCWVILQKKETFFLYIYQQL